LQVAQEGASEHLHACVCRDDHIDIADQRIGLDLDLDRSALDIGEVDGHVTEQGNCDQFILDVPRSGAPAFAPTLEDRIQGEQPAPPFPSWNLQFP
jgi:hypothetical protein